MKADKQQGYFLWEVLLLSLLLMFMAAGAGLYVQAVRLKNTGDAVGTACFLAQSQLAYLQAELDRTGTLPAQSAYLGAPAEMRRPKLTYQVSSQQQRHGAVWQAVVAVSWEGRGTNGRREFSRSLARH